MRYNIHLMNLINSEMGKIKYFYNSQFPEAVAFLRSYYFCKQFTAKELYKHIKFFLKLKFSRES